MLVWSITWKILVFAHIICCNLTKRSLLIIDQKVFTQHRQLHVGKLSLEFVCNSSKGKMSVPTWLTVLKNRGKQLITIFKNEERRTKACWGKKEKKSCRRELVNKGFSRREAGGTDSLLQSTKPISRRKRHEYLTDYAFPSRSFPSCFPPYA